MDMHQQDLTIITTMGTTSKEAHLHQAIYQLPEVVSDRPRNMEHLPLDHHYRRNTELQTREILSHKNTVLLRQEIRDCPLNMVLHLDEALIHLKNMALPVIETPHLILTVPHPKDQEIYLLNTAPRRSNQAFLKNMVHLHKDHLVSPKNMVLQASEILHPNNMELRHPETADLLSNTEHPLRLLSVTHPRNRTARLDSEATMYPKVMELHPHGILDHTPSLLTPTDILKACLSNMAPLTDFKEMHHHNLTDLLPLKVYLLNMEPPMALILTHNRVPSRKHMELLTRGVFLKITLPHRKEALAILVIQRPMLSPRLTPLPGTVLHLKNMEHHLHVVFLILMALLVLVEGLRICLQTHMAHLTRTMLTKVTTTLRML